MITKQQLTNVCHLLRDGRKISEIMRAVGVGRRTVEKARAMVTRVLPIGDLHCGSNVGLTPPNYQLPIVQNPATEETKKRCKWAKMQRECWAWFQETITLLQPIHKCFVMGDVIDGDGSRSGGTEVIVTDRKVQAAIAKECLDYVQADEYSFVYGTPYHTGVAEDFETDVSQHLNAKIGSHEWEEVNGVTFDLKHKQSTTKNPATSLFNEVCDNREWAVLGEQPKADVLVRAHTHRFCMFHVEDCLAISIPSLQAYGTKFGSRQCSRKVTFGMIALDVWPDGVIITNVHIAKLAGHITRVNAEHRS